MNISVPYQQLGDTLCTLPILYYLIDKAHQENDEPKIYFHNKEVQKLIPKNIKYTNIENNFIDEEIDYNIHCFNIWNHNGPGPKFPNLHMMQAHFNMFNFSIPGTNNMKPKIEYPDLKVEEYDFLISPFCVTKVDKIIKLEVWEKVINYLKNNGYTVAIICKSKDEGEKVLENVNYIEGQPIEIVANYLKKVKKAIITIDNGISHLAHIIDVPHLLLYPAIWPIWWVNNLNQNAVVVQDSPRNFDENRIINLINEKILK
jgi:hypothetical protein